MSLAAIGLAVLTTTLDELATKNKFDLPPLLYNGTADGARQLLATLASAMMSVTSVVFSITIVALTLAANQFGPRLLRNFMKDAVSQWTLGIFIATFLFSLLVLSNVRGGESSFVPGISVTFAQGLAILSTGVLIYFIHHISTLIQADQVVRAVHDEVCSAIERLLPDNGDAGGDPEFRFDSDDAAPVKMAAGDYVEGIDYDEAVAIARHHGLVIRFRCRPGQFVPKDEAVADVAPGGKLNDEIAGKIRRAVFFGPTRTPTQDVEFGVLQLAEVAVRSLSPGVNDPFTAISCVDRLGSALREVCDRDYPSATMTDEDGVVRVIRGGTDFEGHMNAAFNQIRQNARGSVAVYIRLLEAFSNISGRTKREDRLAVLRRHAAMVLRESERAISEECDRADVNDAYRRFIDHVSCANR